MEEHDNDQRFVGRVGEAVGHEQEESDEKGEDRGDGAKK